LTFLATLTALSNIFSLFSNDTTPKTGDVAIENIKDVDYMIGNATNRFLIEFEKYQEKIGNQKKKWIFESEDSAMISYILAKLRFLM